MRTLQKMLTMILLLQSMVTKAQSPEQYRKWETEDHKAIIGFINNNEEKISNNDIETLMKILEMSQNALKKDENNPLLLLLAGSAAERFADQPPGTGKTSITGAVKQALDGDKGVVLSKKEKEQLFWSRSAGQYYIKAAAQKEKESMLALARYYRYGYYSDESGKEAVRKVYAASKAPALLLQAAELGSEEAGIMLGELYIKGEGVKKDMELGESYITKASQSDAVIFYEIAKNFAFGERNIYSGRPFEYQYNPAAALHYYTKSADMGNKAAAYFLGLSYAGTADTKQLQITDENPAKAFNYMKKAVTDEKETPEACYYLALFHVNGIGTAKDIKSGVIILEKLLQADNGMDKQVLKELISEIKAKQ